MTATIKSNQFARPNNMKLAWMIAVFGVILPVLAILVEINLRICATSFFDPFPSNLHVMLFSLIPLGNALVLLSMRRDLSDHYAFLCLLNGMSAGIGLTYSLMFLPLMPISLLLVLAFGFGLLGLSPATGLVSTIGAGKIICHQAKLHDTYFDPEHSKHLGHLLVIASIVAIELPSTLTRVHLHMASEPKSAAEGLAWLRQHGDQEVMLRACYERSGRATDVLGSLYECGNPMNVETARRIFYQVTGKPYNSIPIPMSARATMQHAQVAINGALIQDEFDVDTGIAGESVSSFARGLTMDKSNITGDFVQGTADATLEWTFELNNASAYDREARAVLKLPPNAVVNGVNLFIDGKQLESHISVREVARATYRSGISTGRDPLLLSWCGPDSLLVQCYPIHKQSKAQITIDMVAPLAIESKDRGSLWLPYLQEQNFAVKAAPTLELRSRSNIDINTTDLVATKDDGLVSVKGDLAKSQLHVDSIRFTVPVELSPAASKSAPQEKEKATAAPAAKAHPLGVEEKIVETAPRKVKHMLVLIDGSVNLSKYKEQIVDGLAKSKPDVDTEIKVVSDVGMVTAKDAAGHTSLNAQIESLRNFSFVGGQDNSAQLEAALDSCARASDSATIWIHGAQPLAQSSPRIQALLNAKYEAPILFDLQVEPGANQILDGVNGWTSLQRVPSSGSLQADISRLLSGLLNRSPSYALVREGVPQAPAAETSKDQSINPVAVLRARDLVLERLATSPRMTGAELHLANELAVKFDIVTPISSAVVHDPNPSLTLDSPPPPAVPVHRFRSVRSMVSGLAVVQQARQMDRHQMYSKMPVPQRAPASAPAYNAPAKPSASPSMPSVVAQLPSIEKQKVAAEESLSSVRKDQLFDGKNAASVGDAAARLKADYFNPNLGAGSEYRQDSRNSAVQTEQKESMVGAQGAGGYAESSSLSTNGTIALDKLSEHSSSSAAPGTTFSQADDLDADAKPAPEPDDWLLFTITGIALCGAWLLWTRRRTSTSS